jgi:iron(III) transport system substrate-binding protein
LFQLFCFTPECQQLIIEVGGMRSMHPQAKEKPGRKPFAEIKTLKEDAAAVEKEGEAIKARYSKLFGV